MQNLVILILFFNVLLIAAATGIVAVLECRRWLYWRTRAIEAELDAVRARAYANEARQLLRLSAKETWPSEQRRHYPVPVPHLGHRPMSRREPA